MAEQSIDLTKRSNVRTGLMVEIASGEQLHKGIVVEILSKGGNSDGIKVKLSTGEVGNVKRLVSKQEVRLESFKFWNLFLNANRIFSIYDNEVGHFLEIDRISKITGKREVVSLLFDAHGTATAFLKGNPNYSSPRYSVRPIKKNKPLIEHFSKTTHFVGNNSRKISIDSLKDLTYKLSI